MGPRLGLALLSRPGRRRPATGHRFGRYGQAEQRPPAWAARTADRIILELKGKMDGVEIDAEQAGADTGDGELIEVLSAMGYSTTEIRRALANLERSPDMTVEDYLRQALQLIGGW